LHQGLVTRVAPAAEAYDAWYATALGHAMDGAESMALMALATPRAGELALDAGCGTGIYTRRLVERGLRVTAIAGWSAAPLGWSGAAAAWARWGPPSASRAGERTEDQRSFGFA
jgi:SAM-dependent methyltransferase